MLGVIYSAKNTKKVNEVVIKNQMDNITNQIKALEVKMEKHNAVVERTFLLEKAQAEQTRDIKTLYNHIEDIKTDVKEVRTDIEKINSNINEIRISEAKK